MVESAECTMTTNIVAVNQEQPSSIDCDEYLTLVNTKYSGGVPDEVVSKFLNRHITLNLSHMNTELQRESAALVDIREKLENEREKIPEFDKAIKMVEEAMPGFMLSYDEATERRNHCLKVLQATKIKQRKKQLVLSQLQLKIANRMYDLIIDETGSQESINMLQTREKDYEEDIKKREQDLSDLQHQLDLAVEAFDEAYKNLELNERSLQTLGVNKDECVGNQKALQRKYDELFAYCSGIGERKKKFMNGIRSMMANLDHILSEEERLLTESLVSVTNNNNEQ